MTSKTVEMSMPDNGVKGKVVRYESSAPDAIISNVYVAKSFRAEMPKKIYVTVSDEAPTTGDKSKGK